MKKVAFLAMFVVGHIYAQESFVVPSGTTVNTTQTIEGNNQTGLVEEGGAISVSSVTNAVNMLSGSNQQMQNEGSITVVEGTGINCESTSSSAVIINQGTITGSSLSELISNEAPSSIITNYGQLSAAGTYGIVNGANNCTIFNAGGTITAGSGTTAISDLGNNTSIINSGTIQAYLSSAAISMTGTNPSLTLMRGSNIQGVINISNALNLYVEDGINLVLTLGGGSGGFSLLGIDNPYVIQGNRVAVLDPTGLAMQADITADLSDSMLDGLLPRRACLPCRSWIEGFGSYRHRKRQGNIMSYTNYVAGGILGLDFDVRGERFTLFGVAAYDHSTVFHNSQYAEVYLTGGGITFGRILRKTYLDFTVAGAYIRWNNSRTIYNNLVSSGQQCATAEVDGAFATADITASYPFCFSMIAASLRYAGLFLGDYTEEGSISDLTVNHRFISLVTTRLEATLGSYMCKCLCIQPYVGIYGRYEISGYDIDTILLFQSLSFEQGGPKNLGALLAALRGTCGPIFYNAEFNIDDAQSIRVLAEIKWSF